MLTALLTPRERAVWVAAFVLVASLLTVTKFESADPDSALYASIATRLAQTPVSRWIAPQWWGLWPGSGMDELFREHPAGIFILPAVFDRLGIPAAQAVYIVGIAAALVSLLLLSLLVERVTSRAEARATLVLLQVMPVAFIFRIRANHEYPMLACLLVSLVGLEGVSKSWRWLPLVVAGFVGGLLVKGVFVVLILLAAGLWIVTNPTRRAESSRRQWIACALALAAMGAVALLYDAWYAHLTGETFWGPYVRRQFGSVTFGTPSHGAQAIGTHFFFYLTRLLWHPAPWSIALTWLGCRRVLSGAAIRTSLTDSERRGLFFALAFAAFAVIALSPPSRFAERYAFSATYAVGACGAVAAWRTLPVLRTALARIETSLPALSALLWFALMALRLALGPWLPRLQDH